MSTSENHFWFLFFSTTNYIISIFYKSLVILGQGLIIIKALSFSPTDFVSYLASQAVLPAFLALIKAIPWVLKCVFRSDVFSNRLRHTLQVNVRLSSMPTEEGEPGAELSWDVLSWFLPGRGEGSGCMLREWLLSATAFFTLWAMKQWRAREEVDVKQAPHCRHCWLPSVPPRRCWAIWSKNNAWSSVVKPQGAQRNPDSGWE